VVGTLAVAGAVAVAPPSGARTLTASSGSRGAENPAAPSRLRAAQAAPRPRGPSHATTRTTTATPTTASPVALAGCPVPPHAPLPPSPPPWHPATLVTSLPPVTAPAGWTSHVAAITGKGMWIWEWSNTDGGNAAEVVQQAVSAGLHQLWVRVGDSMNGFYGAQELDALVPIAHAHGIAVIAFPYLWDPVGDAQWTAQILDWRGTDGQQVDGYSADIEEATEGVMLSAQRAAVYLELVRHAAGSRLVVATVYPPTDANWNGAYPYAAMAPYVDAFAPMVYWECTDPGTDSSLDVARLSTLRPVHLIGQAFNFAGDGGRTDSPSAAEIAEFLSAGRRAGALGASFWVWQEATPEEWGAVTGFPWHSFKPRSTPRRRTPTTSRR
jgi:hypothetical protein